MRKTLLQLSLLFLSSGIFANSGKIIITEFLAVNSNNIVDEDSAHCDWIEIYNNTDSLIHLDGWHLSDSESNLKEWTFPAVTLNSGSYMVVFASGKDRRIPGKNLHTNFKLSGSGEFLAISEPDTTISHAYSPLFPGQRQDISYGLFHGQEVFFTTPTPGSENLAGTLPFAPQFSKTRGFYTQSFQLELSVPDAGSKIYYTLDGTRPTAANATLYSTAITINANTPVSAISVNAQGAASEIVTNTYYFKDKLNTQTRNPAGYPTDWRAFGAEKYLFADYGMDTRVTQSDAYASKMDSAFNLLPSVTIVTNPGYIFSNSTIPAFETAGIYIYTGKTTYEYTNGTKLDAYGMVRPTSVEYFDPISGKEFQVNCELKLHGGNSRTTTNSPKHGFEFKFKSLYGPSKLNFDIFEEKGAVKEFDKLILRAGYNYTWAKNAALQQSNAQYIQDSWAKNQQLILGNDAAHEKFIHLYINGLYWGVYNITEELNDQFMADYLKGVEGEFDVIRGGETSGTTTVAADGDVIAWTALKTAITSVSSNANYQKIQGKNPDGSINSKYSNLLDVDNYIDYMLLNYYVGNNDWKSNWGVARNRVQNIAGFRFFCWDTETSMVALTDEKMSTNDGAGHPNSFMQYLKNNADFKVKLADRIQNTFLNSGGEFTPDKIRESYEKLADEIELPLIAESARWGDWYPAYTSFNPTTLNTPYTVNDHWIPRKNYLMNEYFAKRTDIVLAQLKAYGLFPEAEAPVFSTPSGTFETKFDLSMSSNIGSILYTMDGTDPRVEITNANAAGAKTYSTPITLGTTDTLVTVKARTKNSSEWSAITTGIYKFNTVSGLYGISRMNLSISNFPNPFSVSTTIQVNIPESAALRIEIWTIDGRKIETLYDGTASAGKNTFVWNPDSSLKGVYICRVNYQNSSEIIKLVKN